MISAIARLVVVLLFLFSYQFATCSKKFENLSTYEKLCELNKYWLKQDPRNFDFSEFPDITNNQELIYAHLILVEKYLRENQPTGLSRKSRKNRIIGLDILREYIRQQNFPKNTRHQGIITPYFIDDFGTYCAVGQMMKGTGFTELALKIRAENNNAYIENMDYPGLLEWSNTYGFNKEELIWIQPSYGCWADRTDIYVTNTNNSGNGSLQWAVQQANNDPEPNTVRFDLPLGSTIYHTNQIWLQGECDAIDGYLVNGEGRIVIDGSNLSVNNWGMVVSCDNCEVSNIEAKNYDNTAIGVWGGSKVYLGNNVLYANRIGLQLANTANSISIFGNIIGITESMENNQPANSEEYGIFLNDVSDINIENNIISGIADSSLDRIGIIVDSDDISTNVTIRNNIIGLSSDQTYAIPNNEGIFVGANNSGVIIENNVISGNNDTGIGLFEATGVIITNNSIGLNSSSVSFPNYYNGIWVNECSDISINENRITGYLDISYGITLQSSNQINIGTSSENTKNEIFNNEVGIYNQNVSNVNIGVNELSCNIYPIFFENFTDQTFNPLVTIANTNEISGEAQPGSLVDIYHDQAYSECECQGNLFIARVQTDNNGEWTYSGPNIPTQVGTHSYITAIATSSAASSNYADCKKIISANDADCFDSTIITGDPCTTQFEPVCGCNAVTYGNACEAIENGIWFFTFGQCDDGCIDPSQMNPTGECSAIYDPVCGCNNVTYANSCKAENAGVSSYLLGECSVDNDDSLKVLLFFNAENQYDMNINTIYQSELLSEFDENLFVDIFGDGLNRQALALDQNNKKLYYIKSDSKIDVRTPQGFGIYSYDINSSVENLIKDFSVNGENSIGNAFISDIAVSADGKYLSIVTRRWENISNYRDGDIFLYDIQNELFTNLTNNFDIMEHRSEFSPDNQYVIYTSNEASWLSWPQNLYKVDLVLGEHYLLDNDAGFFNDNSTTWDSDRIIQGPSYDKISNKILYARGNGGGLWTINPDGSNPSNFNGFTDFMGSRNLIAGRHLNEILFSSGKKIYIALTDGLVIDSLEFAKNIKDFVFIKNNSKIDEDGDGFESFEDCDDMNASVNPNANEIPYNGLDDDCNSSTHDDDLDNDGFGIDEDCDDTNPSINPLVIEIPYNGWNDDCNSNTPDDDLDSDGFGIDEDCDDTNPSINPLVIEIPYNGWNDDCNSNTPDDDLDNDGFGIDEDCDDTNPSINPLVIEIPYNGWNDDCNSNTPDDDLDNDGFGIDEDCDDTDPNINPNSEEIANNGIDEDCDGNDLISSLNEVDLNAFILIKPNPTKDMVYITNGSNEEVEKIEVYSQLGICLDNYDPSNLQQIDLRELNAGVYILRLKFKNRLSHVSKKIVVLK